MSKFNLNGNGTTDAIAKIYGGREIGTVVQVMGVGYHPAFKEQDPAVQYVGVVFQLGSKRIAKMMTLSTSRFSNLHGLVTAAIPDFEGADITQALPQILGRPVALEIEPNGRFESIASISQPETFELPDAPKFDKADLIYIPDFTLLKPDEAKQKFQLLHRDLRSWWSKRIRGI